MRYIDRYLSKFGAYVVQQAKSNLVKGGHNTSDSKSLYKSLSYEVDTTKTGYTLSISMEDYGEFLDQGVRGAGGVRKTTSSFNSRNNKGKLWKIKGKNSPFKFGKSGGISYKHFIKFAEKKGLSPYAVAKAVYHQGIETTLFITEPFEKAIKNLPEPMLENYSLDVENQLKIIMK